MADMADISFSRFSQTQLKRQMALEKQTRQIARQENSKEAFLESCEAGNQYIASVIAKKMRKQARSLEERNLAKMQEKESLFDIGKSETIAQEHENENPELNARTLLILRSKLTSEDTPQEIIEKVLETYSDYSLADDALSFLEKSSEGELLQQVKNARSQFTDSFKREITAGKNIALEARTFSERGLGSPTALRDLYRDITGNPRIPNKLFEELSEQFTFLKMETTIRFLLHSLGSDLKSKGPSIPRGELSRLMTETKTLQAILGVYRFFQSRMSIIHRLFDKHALYLPYKVNFEELAKKFMKLVEDRYPSAVKVIKLAQALDIEDEILAQIIIYSQFRDGIRHIAPKLYRSLQHRDELLEAILEALEELEDLYEQEDE